MAKQGKHGELNWHKGQMRWYKKIKNPETGKYDTKYFGPMGRGPSDRKCKKLALEEWAERKAELDIEKRVQKVMQLVNAVGKGILPISDLGNSAYEQRMLEVWTRDRMVTRPDAEGNQYVNRVYDDPKKPVLKKSHRPFIDPDTRDVEDDSEWVSDEEEEATQWAEDPVAARKALQERRRREREVWAEKGRKATKPVKRGTTIADHVDAWLEAEGARAKADDLTPTALRDKRSGITTFKEFVNGELFGTAEEVDELLIRYRGFIQGKVADESYSGNTANDKLKFAKQFILWAWQNNRLKEQPRQLDTFARKFHVEKAGKPLTVDELQKLWGAAGDRMKCWIALGLNCAFKPGDIHTLVGSNIKGNRLVGIRQKTRKSKVPMNYQLWPLTVKLIKQHRDGTRDDQLLFINRNGNQYTTQSFGVLFQKAAKKAGVKATFEQLRDTSAELVKQALFKNGGELSLLQVFLAHKDKSTAQYYVSDDPAHLKSPKLDKIVKGLEKTYGLK